MKKLIRNHIPPKTVTYVNGDTVDFDDIEDSDDSEETEDTAQVNNDFNYIDLVDILLQVEELKNYNIAIKEEDGALLLGVGDSRYEIMPRKSRRYPRRKLRKLET